MPLTFAYYFVQIVAWMKCIYCKNDCIKKGVYKAVQEYQCKQCKKSQRSVYCYRQYDKAIREQMVVLNNEGLGICSISRILKMPKSTVQWLLLKASLKIMPPVLNEQDQEYEVDELFACTGRKRLCYIIYAINRTSRQIIYFVTGTRTKENIAKVIQALLLLHPRKIYTDQLPVFRYLIPDTMHRVLRHKTNRIERKNLTLRTHLRKDYPVKRFVIVKALLC